MHILFVHMSEVQLLHTGGPTSAHYCVFGVEIPTSTPFQTESSEP